MEYEYLENDETRKKDVSTAMDNFGHQVSLGVLQVLKHKAQNDKIEITDEILKSIIHDCAAIGLFMVIEQSMVNNVIVVPGDLEFPTFQQNRSNVEKQGSNFN